MKYFIRELRISLMATLSLVILLCGIYPSLVWIVGQGLFPAESNGSLLVHKGTIVGSNLFSQGFNDPKYFHPRPSAAGQGYDAVSSGGSNLGPISKKLVDRVRQRVVDYRNENDFSPGAIVPADAVTASASGLDPHISVKNAVLQARRVAKARNLPFELVMEKVAVHTDGRTFGILGEPRVNVLMLNLDLDGKL
jgi:K+-transporting ATPase ATPase C chain